MEEINTAKRIELLYQDEHILICVKPAGVDSQDGMCARLAAQTGKDVRCVHRLDRNVGGVMVYALTANAAAALGKAIALSSLEKEYLAVCHGCPASPEGEMRDLLYHDAAKNKSYVVKRPRRGVREASLSYRLLDAGDGRSLVRIRLHTGRSHQIRVQFASRSMPLLGDAKYGSPVRGAGIALWAHTLTLPHPQTGALLRFSAAPPQTPPWTDFNKEVWADA